MGRGPSCRVMLKSLNLVVRVMGNTETRDMIRFMLWKEHPGCGVEEESEAWCDPDERWRWSQGG